MAKKKDKTEAKDEAPAPKRYRLLTRAFMHGALREPGHIFTLAEGEVGPHRTVIHGADVVHQEGDRDADREVPAAKDVPLYEEVVEETPESLEDRQHREIEAFEKKCQAEYEEILARHAAERGEGTEDTSSEPAGEPAALSADVTQTAPADDIEHARSIADPDWDIEKGRSIADPDWDTRREGGAPIASTMNRPYGGSGPGAA